MQLENNLKIYKTNSALGYNQYAYLLQCTEGFLVVDTIGCYGDDTYKIGEIKPIDYFEYLELEESNYDIESSPLYDTFLFQFFIKTIYK